MDSDADIEFIEKDSGMSSLGGSKDETPERRTEPTPATTIAKKDLPEVETFEDEPAETFGERLYGLTEMFPDPIRNFSGKLVDLTVGGAKSLYTFSRNASWIFFTSSVILFAPVIFETERAQMEEMQKSQQKQVLLGPGATQTYTAPGGAPALPSI